MVVKKGDESHGRIRKESPTKQLKDSWFTHCEPCSTHLKIEVKLDHFPKDRGDNKIYTKPPPRL